MRLTALSLFILVGACHANSEAVCGQTGDAPCDADAGRLCVNESETAPFTCESTISCWQPLTAYANPGYVVESTWALAQQWCSSQQSNLADIYSLSPSPCDGLVAFGQTGKGASPMWALYAVDGGALVALFNEEDLGPQACVAGDVTFSARCLQTLWSESVPCGNADAGPDSSDVN